MNQIWTWLQGIPIWPTLLHALVSYSAWAYLLQPSVLDLYLFTFPQFSDLSTFHVNDPNKSYYQREDLTQIPLVNVAYCMSPLVKHNVCLYTKGSGEFCSQLECKLSSAFCDHTYYYSVEETLEYPGSINVLWGTIQHLQCLGNSLTYLGEARWEAESLPTREVTIAGLCVPSYLEKEAGHS